MNAYAFPTENSHGITLKDWFAGQIIAALLGCDSSNSTQRDKNGQLCKMDQAKLVNLANSAYQAADALLQVRADHERREHQDKHPATAQGNPTD